jgi:hypothetical protein
MTEKPQTPYNLLTGNEIEIGDLLIAVDPRGQILSLARIYGIKLKPSRSLTEGTPPSSQSDKYSIILAHREENPKFVVLLKKDGKVFLSEELYEKAKEYIENPKPLVQ